MKKSQAMKTTMDAMRDMLAGVPDTPGAWVPLRRATVEEALHMLGNLETIVDAVRYLGHFDEEVPHEVNPVPTWRYPVLSAEDKAAGQDENVAQLAYKVTTARSNGNGAERLTYTQPAASSGKARSDERPTNGWRRLPKAERLALVCAEIARLAGDRSWLTQVEFNQSKPESMPKASAMAMTLGVTWVELVTKALPHAVVPAAQPASRKGTAAPAAETFREIAAKD